MPRPDSVFDASIVQAIAAARSPPAGAPAPFPSPTDWRDRWIYLVMLDRFSNPVAPPAQSWNQPWPRRQGGTFNGVKNAIPYLKDLGVGALWLTPVVKNPAPQTWLGDYAGYAAQDLLQIEGHFASDGTEATAEIELRALVDAAHKAGMHVVLDIVINHTARVFDYVLSGATQTDFQNSSLLYSPPTAGGEPPVEWIDGYGFPRADWQGELPPIAALGPHDAVHPASDFRTDYFRRRGDKLSDEPIYNTDGDPTDNFAPGDFGWLRQLCVEYAVDPTDPLYRRQFGANPVLTILARAYAYFVARFDFDAFRIDTVKYVQPNMVLLFANAMREFALTIGKTNFFTFGEIWDQASVINAFVGRHTDGGFGIDAALDYPLFYQLQWVAKGMSPVESLRAVFDSRATYWETLLSSHGEAGRYFVTFLDNHDQSQRVRDVGPNGATPEPQVQLALSLLFTLLGIPCVYYGTEQGLSGAVDGNGNRAVVQYEGVREALWGRPGGLDATFPTYQAIQSLAALRASEPVLRYGRQYFRPVAGNGADFGLPTGLGGVVAFSRILNDREVLIVANTSATSGWQGSVQIDRELNSEGDHFVVRFGNLAPPPANPPPVRYLNANFWSGATQTGSGPAACLDLTLRTSEIVVLSP
jgi:glycosidase